MIVMGIVIMIQMVMVFADELEISGCQDNTACNYDSTAIDAGSCSFPVDLYPSLNIDGVSYVDCDGNCNNDSDGDGVCDEVEITGCRMILHVIMILLQLMIIHVLIQLLGMRIQMVMGWVTQIFLLIIVMRLMVMFQITLILVQMILRMMRMVMGYVRVMR